MKLSATRLAKGLVAFCLLFPGNPAHGEGCDAANRRQLRFKPGQDSAAIRGVLKPEATHIYRFRAKAGQPGRVYLLLPRGQRAATGDVVFVVQHIGNYIPGTSSQFLEGIDGHGNTDWTGQFPVNSEYEIRVFTPEISDHVVNHPVRYILGVSIKKQVPSAGSSPSPKQLQIGRAPMTTAVITDRADLSAPVTLDQKAGKQKIAAIDNAAAVERFVRDLQDAVAKGDRGKVAGMIDYPIVVCVKGREVTLRRRSDFVGRYEFVFTKQVKEALAKQDPSKLFKNWQGIMVGEEGEIWLNEATGSKRILIWAINN